MAKGFSEQLKEQAWDIWQRIFQHPFLKEAQEGTLPLEKFRYYIIQDYKYLEAFARCVALALAKAPNTAALESISKRLVTPIERPLHQKLMPLLEITEDDLEAAPIAPTNLAYCNHMLSAASLGSSAVAAAALLPCPWTYHELGRFFGKIDHPIFGPWSSVYAEGLLGDSVALWTRLLDEAGSDASNQEQTTITRAFITSSRYEFLFWDMAYKQESWTI